MVVWLAFGVSALALVISVVSAVYTRRQAVAAEDANWSANPPEFVASIEDAHSGAARLLIDFRGGGPLDRVDVDILDPEASPLMGFGVGTVEGTGWSVGSARAGQSWRRPVVQRMSDPAKGGPPYREGNVRLRVTCRHRRHARDLVLDVTLPSQPWVY